MILITGAAGFIGSAVAHALNRQGETALLLCDHFGEQHLYQNLFEPIQILSVAPNPASANTTVQIECNKNSDVSINIADIHGRNVFTQESYIQEGVSTVPINLAGLNAGFYIIHITSERIIKSTKLVIQ